MGGLSREADGDTESIPAEVTEDIVGAFEEIVTEDIVGASEEIVAEDIVRASEEIVAENIVGASEEIVTEDIVRASEGIVAEDIAGVSEEIVAEDIVGVSEEIVTEDIVGASEEIVAEDIVGVSEEIVAEESADVAEEYKSGSDKEKSPEPSYMYIVRCRDDSLYTGWTNHLHERLAAHNAGRGAKYTRSRRPVELVYYEEFGTKEEAMSREFHVKRLTRAQKLRLVGDGSVLVRE